MNPAPVAVAKNTSNAMARPDFTVSRKVEQNSKNDVCNGKNGAGKIC